MIIVGLDLNYIFKSSDIFNFIWFTIFVLNHQINLNKECPFWARKEMCTSGNSCQICECNEEHVPQPWKMKPIRNFVDRNHYADESLIKPWGGQQLATDDADDDNDDNDVDTVTEFKRTNGFGIGVPENKVTVSDERSSAAQYVDLTLNRAGFTGNIKLLNGRILRINKLFK